MTEVPPTPPQSGSFGRAGDAWRDLGHRMRLMLADRIASPRFNTLATLGGSRLSAESRLAVAVFSPLSFVYVSSTLITAEPSGLVSITGGFHAVFPVDCPVVRFSSQ